MRKTLVAIGVMQVLILIVGLARAKGLSILLGPSGMGVASTVDQLVLVITQLSALGLPFTALKFMSAAHGESQEKFRRTNAAFMRVVLALAIATVAASILVFYAYPALIGADMARYNVQVLIALIGIVPATMIVMFVNTLASAQNSAGAALFNLASVAALAAAAVIGAKLGGVTGLYVAAGAVGVVGVVGAFAFFRARLGLSLFASGVPLIREIAHGGPIVTTALWVYCAMLSYAVCLFVVRYAVFSGLGEAPAGLMQASISISLSVGSIVAAMSNLHLIPTLNRAGQVTEKVKAANDFAAKVALFLLFGALPVVLFPRLIITILYTNAFGAAAGTLALFVSWQCLSQLMNVYQQLLIGLDQVRYMALAATAGFAASGAVAVPLVDRAGIYGAPIALFVGTLLAMGLIVGRLVIALGISVPGGLVLRIAFVTGVLAGARVLFGAETEATLAGAFWRVGYAVCAFGAVWLFLDARERSSVQGAINLGRRFLFGEARLLP
jgi:O-antigen/teichoic acid export membrane protein